MKTSSAVSKPSVVSLAALFFRIGNQTFGSGSTTIVLLSREMNERRWLHREECELYYTLARVVPGTNLLAFVGAAAYAIRGWYGALLSMVAYTVPAAGIVVLLTLAYERWRHHALGGEFISAAMSSIVGIIAGAAWLLAAPGFRRGQRLRTAVLVAGAILLSFYVAPLTVLGIGAAIGWFWPKADEE